MYSKYFKRLFDIIFSLVLIILLFPIMLLIFFLVWCVIGYPIFCQKRPGLNNKIFTIYKFKTLYDPSNNFSEKERQSKFGNFLRKTGLDELPQLINVLKEDMSIVGPRPLPKSIEKKIKKSIRVKRRKILPGITGMSQINYTGKNRKLTEKIKLDLQLIDNYTLNNYFKILLRTPIILIIRFFKNKSSIIK